MGYLVVSISAPAHAKPATPLSVARAEGSKLSVPVTMKGSDESLLRAYNISERMGYTRAKTKKDIAKLVASKALVQVATTRLLEVDAGVSFPVTRPFVRSFLYELASQYNATCDEKLVVTSLTRAITTQPKNASRISVHPSGMAVDLRIPSGKKCRTWFEKTLLSYERRMVIDLTKEKHPPHYHIVVFPPQNTHTTKVARK
jgi:hypothetical protein